MKAPVVRLERVSVRANGELCGPLSLSFPDAQKAGVYREKSSILVVGKPLVRLYEKAVDAFLSPGTALDWMQEEQGGLGGRRPVDLALDPTGLRLAEDELLRLVHGILA